ncbi:folylpolyglutamate synthase [Tulasnella sp. 419]|nr:folylpolyglutamate synthase [Tulasnella sp. 419]
MATIDLSLARIRSLLSHLPQYTRPTIHVAGTNGKGSVTTMVDSILRESGFTTGRFNSPHLVHVHDSIKINGTSISKQVYEAASKTVGNVDLDKNIGATSFELLTATALYSFQKESVDVAVVEVGMGGRLDATNSIPDEAIVAFGVTSIAMDHQAFLGNSLDLIAREKAAISRRGKPCVIAEQSDLKVKDAINAVIEEHGSKAFWTTRAQERPWSIKSDGPFTPFSLRPFRPPPPRPISVATRTGSIDALLPLHGDHQLLNVSVAVGLIDAIREYQPFHRITDLNIMNGIRDCHWPGRLEWINSTDFPTLGRNISDLAILVDGAHNAACSSALTEYLDSLQISGPRTFIISLSHSPPKTPLSTLQPLLKEGDIVTVVPFSEVDGMPWVKPVAQAELEATVSGLVGRSGRVHLSESLRDALKWARTNTQNGLVVMAGSLYLIADLYRLLE